MIDSLIYAFLGGMCPAIVWLLFWLREDAAHPEPRGLILRTFIGGSFAVLLVLPFQRMVDRTFPGMPPTAFLLWALLEEGFKWSVAYFIAIRGREDNEPLDPMIYMIVAALGFVALENTLFIVNPLLQKDVMMSLVTGNLRFIGASLLHIVSSSTIGAALALNFYKPKSTRILWGIFAFILAVLIHTTFNLFIITEDLGTFLTFGTVWAGITILMLIFEKVKTIVPQANSISTLNK